MTTTSPVPATDTANADAPTDEAPSDTTAAPWWTSAVNRASIAIGIAILAAALGWLVGNNRAIPDPSATDIGFLHDMRAHHEQAVQMAWIYLEKPDGLESLNDIARSIIVSQNREVGRMLQLLDGFGAPAQSDTDIAMVWMGEATSLDRMPGMATESDIDRLVAAQGRDADKIFADLMVLHHEGGIHMMQYAVSHAEVSSVVRFATFMLGNQQDEINEIRSVVP